MSKTPKISVFIPLYNREDYIKEAIESVLSQSLQDFEICVYDDGSTDDSAGIVKELAEKYNQQREIIRLECGKINRGSIISYNKSMQMCRGRYLAQLDSDDLLLPEALAKLSAVLDKRPEIGLVFSHYNYIDKSGKFFAEGCFGKEIDETEIKKIMFYSSCCVYHLRMFRKELLSKVNGCSEPFHLCPDYDLYIKMAEMTNIAKVPEVLYSQRWHENNMSNINNNLQQMSARLVQLKSARRRINKLNKELK